MTTIPEWREFLQRWSDDWLEADTNLPVDVRAHRWLGFEPASEQQVVELEVRLGYRLPPSYRAFLQTSNGWGRTSFCIERLRPAAEVEWLEVDEPQLLDALSGIVEYPGPFDGLTREEYFSYDGRPAYDSRHFAKSLKIADPVGGDTAIYVLNPQVATEDGEWEAWLHAHWIPGANRYPSFAHLMRAEYQSFRQTEFDGKSAARVVGPFDGVYAPKKRRQKAKRIGRGKPKPRRLSVSELIDQLEDPAVKVRLKAAQQLFREYKPHDPGDERPELVERLSRILRSAAESDVRCAAACMLGSYGDPSAIDPLIVSLQDAEVASTAVSALFYLSIDIKDARIADALIAYLAEPRDVSSMSTALNVLADEFRDSRLAPIALRILESDIHRQFRYHAAFALAKVSESAADELIARLNHANPEVRAAVAAGLRQTGDRRAIDPLRAALKDDTDPEFRTQAICSLRFLEEDTQVSPADEAVRSEQIKSAMRSLGIEMPDNSTEG